MLVETLRFGKIESKISNMPQDSATLAEILVRLLKGIDTEEDIMAVRGGMLVVLACH